MTKAWLSSIILCMVYLCSVWVEAQEKRIAPDAAKGSGSRPSKPLSPPQVGSAAKAPSSRPVRPTAPKPVSPSDPSNDNGDDDDDDDDTAAASPSRTPVQEPPLYSIDTAATPAPSAKSALAQILKNQVLRVCVRADIPPFGHFFNHTLVGFDIQLAQDIGVQLSIYYKKNLRLSWLIINAGARIQSLVENHCDMVVAAFSITAARARLVSFSEPYLQTYKVIVKKAKITRSEPIIALVRGTTTGGQKLRGKIRYFRNYNEIIHAMERADIDYTVTDQPIAIHMLRSVTQAYSIVQILPQSENYGIGLSQKSHELRKAINRALKDIARSGRLAYAQRQWL